MRRYLAFALIALSFAAGCAKEEPKKEEKPAPPPEPTAQQIYTEIKTAAQPIYESINSYLPPELMHATLAAVPPARAKYNGKEHQKEAVQRLTGETLDFVRRARDMKDPHKPQVELGGILLWEQLTDNKDKRFEKRKADLALELARPVVKVRGFVGGAPGESPVAFMRVKDPQTKEEKMYTVKEGEEFHGVMKFIKVIGNQQKVQLEYIPLHLVYEIPGPRENIN